MKRIYLLSLLVLGLFTACEKYDRELAPGERPDERLIKTLSEYKAQLVGAEHGWKAMLYPEGGAAYSFFFRFGDNDRVAMASDINASTAGAPVESTYRLKAVQRPSLLFDTYSHLHILSDPDETKSGGERGQGKYSDFEFSFISSSPDTIRLTGNMKGSELVLMRATADEAANFIPQVFANARTLENINTFTTYFKRLTVGGNMYEVNLEANSRVITFTYYEGNTPRHFSTSFYYTTEGVQLLEPFVQGGTTISSFTDLQFNTVSRRLSLNIDNTAATIQEAAAPIRVNIQAARDFLANPNDEYWVALSGFMEKGVPDVDQLASLPNFAFALIWPSYGAEEGRDFDLFGFVLNTANGLTIGYGPAAFPTLTADGRITYAHFGTLGTVPAEAEAQVQATVERWTEPEGFYVVQTSETTLDLVSAKDAQTWINLIK